MKISAAIELVWDLAAREAIAAEFKEIAPEHLIAALLKFSELEDKDLRNVVAMASLADLLATERDALRKVLEEYSIASTTVRRSVRARLGKGGVPYKGDQIHRSPACRETFAAAQKIAEHTRSECLNAHHLFVALVEHPTPIIAEFLEGSKATVAKSSQKATHLQKYTRDLTEFVAQCDSTQSPAHEAAVKALVEVLMQKEDKRCVILVTNDDETATMVILFAAQRLLARTVPVELRRKHIMEIVFDRMLQDIRNQFHPSEELGYLFTTLFAEANSAANMILWIPSFKQLLQETPVMFAIAEVVRNGTSQIIFTLPEYDYDHRFHWGGDLREASHVMWLRNLSETEMPREL